MISNEVFMIRLFLSYYRLIAYGICLYAVFAHESHEVHFHYLVSETDIRVVLRPLPQRETVIAERPPEITGERPVMRVDVSLYQPPVYLHDVGLHQDDVHDFDKRPRRTRVYREYRSYEIHIHNCMC